MIEVFVEGLEFFGHHGATAEERVAGNRFRGSIRAYCEGLATTTDQVSDTVDYSILASILQRVNGESEYATVERLAGRACEEALKLPGVLVCSVTILKLNPPMLVAAESAGVTVQMTSQGAKSPM